MINQQILLPQFIGVQFRLTQLLLACFFFTSAGALYAAVTFDWATVGNPGNAPDATGLDAVSYVYRISKHEVTNDQYRDFLNAVDPKGTNRNSVYNAGLNLSSLGGIAFNAEAAPGSDGHRQSGLTARLRRQRLVSNRCLLG
ncbi:MAG: hypothetical protein U0795_00640 [Pirellulales bacterium]